MPRGIRARLYTGQRPVSLEARLRQLERDLTTREPWLITEGWASYQAWLAGDPDAPKLIEELEGYLGPAVGISAALGHPQARLALAEVSHSLLTFKPSREEPTWEQHS